MTEIEKSNSLPPPLTQQMITAITLKTRQRTIPARATLQVLDRHDSKEFKREIHLSLTQKI